MGSIVNFVHGCTLGTAEPAVHHNLSERQTGAVFPLRVV